MEPNKINLKDHFCYRHEVNKHIRDKNFKQLYNYTNFELHKIFTESFFERCKNEFIIKYIIDNHSSLYFNNKIHSNILMICYHGTLKTLQNFIENIPNKNLIENYGCYTRYPIHYICISNSYKKIKWALESDTFQLDLEQFTEDGLNYIQLINEEILERLIDEKVIDVRKNGLLIKYLQEYQTVEMVQDAIDHDPTNK